MNFIEIDGTIINTRNISAIERQTQQEGLTIIYMNDMTTMRFDSKYYAKLKEYLKPIKLDKE